MRYATAPASPRFNVTANALSSTAILVNWDMVPPMERNGIITEYQVLYQHLDTLTGVIGAEMMERVSSMETSVVLSGLEESAFYVISVRARTTEGEGPSSDHMIVKTLEHGKLSVKHFGNKFILSISLPL